MIAASPVLASVLVVYSIWSPQSLVTPSCWHFIYSQSCMVMDSNQSFYWPFKLENPCPNCSSILCNYTFCFWFSSGFPHFSWPRRLNLSSSLLFCSLLIMGNKTTPWSVQKFYAPNFEPLWYAFSNAVFPTSSTLFTATCSPVAKVWSYIFHYK